MEDFKGLKYVKDIEVLVVHTMNYEAEEILTRDGTPFPFDDDGVAPAGPARYVPIEEVDLITVKELEANQLGHRANARVFVGYNDTDEQKRELDKRFPHHWCGYLSRVTVYTCDVE